MPTFDFPPLLWWGLPLVAVPPLIHLLNLVRRRRVRFAALEFLLASQRRHRTSVRLRQILLLALRTAAVLGLVLALAQPRWRHALAGVLGRGRTAHVLMLDDSCSMNERAVADGVTAFDRGRQVAARLVTDLAAAGSPQELSLGRFSACSGPAAPGGRFDLAGRVVAPGSAPALRDAIAALEPSASAAGPAAALAAVPAPAGGSAGLVVWLVSDFRATDWQTAGPAAAELRRLADSGAELRLVDCGSDQPAGGGNLTVERLELAGGVPAKNAVVTLEVAIRNDSDAMVRDLPVELREDGVGRPGVRVAEVPPRGVATARFRTRFTDAGPHVVEARVPADVLPDDDVRTVVIDVTDGVDVLLVDGDPRGGARAGDAFYVAAALAPGAGAPTGLRPRIEPPRALAALDLAAFDSIWLLDVERLDAAETAALESFAREGGGVVFFTGPRTDADTVNRLLHRDGAGPFPVPLAGPVDLLPDPAAATAPDIVTEDHPVVAVLSGQRNPLLDGVRVERFLAVERGFEPRPGDGFRRLLSLRSGAPLLVERPFGRGLVAALLTTAAPAWNTFARGSPGWVVVMLELESHLARARRRAETALVGDPLAVRLEAGRDEIEVDFAVPPQGAIVRQTAVADAAGRLVATLPAARVSGAYEARWRRVDGTEAARSFAVNVDPAEGRLERIGRDRLGRALSGIPFRYDAADALGPAREALAGTPLAGPLLQLLVVVLVAEQLLARIASYHAAPRQDA